jgi:hypothetical protein
MRVAPKLAALELTDWQGRPRTIGSFWEQQPVVLVFIRHFG